MDHDSPGLSAATDLRTLGDELVVPMLGRLLGDIPAESVRAAAHFVRWQRISSRAMLFCAGDPGDALFLLVTGRLEVFVRDASGGENVVGQVQPGECVGEMAVLTGDVRTASVRAVRDSILLRITAEDFRALSRAEPKIVSNMLGLVVHRLRQTYAPRAAFQTGRTLALVPLAEGLDPTTMAARLARAMEPLGTVAVLDLATLSDGPTASQSVTAWLSHTERASVRLLVCPHGNAPLANRIVRRVDAVLLLADSTGDPTVGPFETAALANTDPASLRPTLVLLHRDAAVAPRGTRWWFDGRTLRDHFHLRTEGDRDYARLARYVTGNSLALVLGGGGARGFAHLGVIAALEERDINVDIACGTSMGAVVAAGLAMDLPSDEIRARALVINKGRPFTDFTFPLLSAIRGRRFDRLLAGALGAGDIEDLWKPYFCVSSSLSRAEARVHRRGALQLSVRASMGMPGVMPPVLLDGELLVDGGVVNNFPVDIARQEFRCRTLGVSVSVHEEVRINEPAYPSFWRYLYDRFIRRKRDYRVPTFFDVMAQTVTLASYRKQVEDATLLDVFLHPAVEAFGMMDLHRFTDIVARGHVCAVEHGDAIARLAAEIGQRPRGVSEEVTPVSRHVPP